MLCGAGRIFSLIFKKQTNQQIKTTPEDEKERVGHWHYLLVFIRRPGLCGGLSYGAIETARDALKSA